MVAAEGCPAEFHPALERIAVDPVRMTEVAQLELDRLGDIGAELVRLGFDQKAAGPRIAQVDHHIDIDRYRARLRRAIDDFQFRQQVERVQQVDERFVL